MDPLLSTILALIDIRVSLSVVEMEVVCTSSFEFPLLEVLVNMNFKLVPHSTVRQLRLISKVFSGIKATNTLLFPQ